MARVARGYDLIGDIHGYAGPLRRLLERLGYRQHGGCYRHPDRQAIFLGDLIDRGPAIRDVLRIVRSMVEGGAARAVMGNHEFNAIAYHTPDGSGGYLRRRSDKNRRQHEATLEAFRDHAEEWEGHLAWFKQLPLYLEMPGFRVVHACWDEQRVAAVNGGGRLGEAKLRLAACPGSLEHDAVSILIQGPELPLPKGCTFLDGDGAGRSKVRVRWWLPRAGRTYQEVAMSDCGAAAMLRVPAVPMPGPNGYPADAPVVFVGHYGLAPGQPAPLARNVVCLDYSVAKGGPLVAYRWNGEATLREDAFVIGEERVV